jgi:hypothetical protein
VRANASRSGGILSADAHDQPTLSRHSLGDAGGVKGNLFPLSPHGLRSDGHDYAGKLAIINEFGGARAMDLKNRLLKATGKDLDPVGDKDFITSLDPES